MSESNAKPGEKPKHDDAKKKSGEHLSEKDLNEVSGGLNPQPLPPIVIDKI